MTDIDSIRKDFPLLKEDRVYLDSSATSLTPEPVIQKMLEYYRDYRSNVGRGIYRTSQRATEEYEAAREKVATFIGAGKGEIELEGAVRYTLDDICGKAGFLFQNPDEQLFAATVEDEIAFGPRQLGMQCDTEAYLEAYGMKQYRNVHPSQLSCGERQRVAFISILAMCPEIIILDEPTTGLDRANWVRLMDTAAALNSQGKTVIFSSHNMNVVEMYARRVIRLEAGRVVSDEIRA
jgi:energy-coupling factor transporter ATP-binding protein EcfA2